MKRTQNCPTPEILYSACWNPW